MDMKKIEAAAKAVQLPKVTPSPLPTRSPHLSFSIVNSKKNGKRVRFSGDLGSVLNLTDNADILPIVSENLLMIATKLPYDSARRVVLKDDKKVAKAKIAYDTDVVRLLTEQFSLSFDKHTSLTFSDIEIEHLSDETLVALIHMDSTAPQKVNAPVEQRE